MFRAFALLSTVLGASAFSPSSRRAASSSLKMAFDASSEPGASGPLGFWDPAGNYNKFSTFLNLIIRLTSYLMTSTIIIGLAKSEAAFADYRQAELKHGRVAQLAVLGYVVPEFFKFPGQIAPGISFESIPNGIKAIEAVPTGGWLQMLALVSFFPSPFVSSLSNYRNCWQYYLIVLVSSSSFFTGRLC